MLHDDIVREIQARATKRGMLSHYCGHAIHCKGDRGAPDLFVVGPYGMAWFEVKTGGADLSPGQTSWRHMLTAADQTYLVAVEAHLDDGRIDRMLDGLAYE